MRAALLHPQAVGLSSADVTSVTTIPVAAASSSGGRRCLSKIWELVHVTLRGLPLRGSLLPPICQDPTPRCSRIKEKAISSKSINSMVLGHGILTGQQHNKKKYMFL